MPTSRELLDRYRRMADASFTVVDVETTGLKPPQARVIEVSILQGSLQDGIRDQFTTLIDPGIPVPEVITRITGIDTSMLTGAPTAPHIWPRLHPRLESGVLVAHNLSFDYRFLRAELQREQIDWSRPEEQQLCTVRLSRRLLSELPSRSLPDLVRHFDFPVGVSHRAEADTRACWHLLVLLMDRLLGSDEASLLTELGNEWLSLSEAARIAGLSRQATLRRLREQGPEPRVPGRGGQPLGRGAWAEALRASS